MKNKKSSLIIGLMVLVYVCLSEFVYDSLAKTDIGASKTIRVAVTGDDAAGCGTELAPCRTIQYAVDAASSGDAILVAKGTYTYNASVDSCSAHIGITGIVCILNKQLTILGGYAATDWSHANPQFNTTIIDGQNTYRGVLVQRTGPSSPTTSLSMMGFTIQNCKVQGAASGGDTQTFAFGGGMLTDASWITLKMMVFKNNAAIGGNTTSAYGGSGSGGGLALRTAPGVTLEHITFEDNLAQGGVGPERGGYAVGGGLYTFKSIVSGSYITFTHNQATGGNSSGSGEFWGKADALGGGLASQIGSTVVFDHAVATGNIATGGNAASYAGGAFGGALFSEGQPNDATNFTLRDAYIYGNQAIGGNSISGNGGHAAGGGGQFDKSSITFERVYVLNNDSLGGNGAKENGPAGGGGLYLQNLPGADITVSFVNTVVADNLVRLGTGTVNQGGGGGGFWLQCMNNAQIIHSTIANNVLEVQGQSLGWVQGYALNVGNDGCPSVPSDVRINYSIISGHAGTALCVKQSNTARLDFTLWNNTTNTNVGGGTIIETNTVSQKGNPAYVSPGSPNYDYHILKSSDAKDKAIGSTLTTDIDGDNRSDGFPDVGADERVPAVSLSASAVNASTLRLNWQADVGQLPGLDHYWLVYSYEAGANPPREGSSPINVGAVMTYQLTGLSTYKKYALTLEAYDAAGQLLDTSNTVVAFPTDIFVYLPLVMKW